MLIRKQVTCQEGTAAIEFAILLPVLVIIIFGIIEFGLLLYNRQVLTNASREGARAGIVQQNPRVSDGEIESIVNNYCGSYLVTFGTQDPPTTTIIRTGLSFPANLTVRVEYHYDFLVLPNFVGSLIGGTNLTARTIMVME